MNRTEQERALSADERAELARLLALVHLPTFTPREREIAVRATWPLLKRIAVLEGALGEVLGHFGRVAVIREITPVKAEAVRHCPMLTSPMVADVLRWHGVLTPQPAKEDA